MTRDRRTKDDRGPRTDQYSRAESLLWNDPRIRHEREEMPRDELLNDDVRLLPRDLIEIELVLPEIGRATEVFRQKRNQASGKRIPMKAGLLSPLLLEPLPEGESSLHRC